MTQQGATNATTKAKAADQDFLTLWKDAAISPDCNKQKADVETLCVDLLGRFTNS
jgi:hypothetical protein